MTKTAGALLSCTVIAIAGCATTDGDDKAVEKSHKMGVVQVGAKQNTDFVFCEEASCPQRTKKVLPLPPRVESPRLAADTKPAVVHPVRFKVHFRWGWSRLDQEGQREVAKVVELPGVKGAREIVIAGRTDPSGSRRANEKLALKRAQTVKAALVMAGVPEAIIKAEVQRPCCDGDKTAAHEVMRELRRTDIDITITK